MNASEKIDTEAVAERRGGRPMHVCFALLYYDPSFRTLESFLEHTVLLRHLPQAVAVRGHTVDVVLLFRNDAMLVDGGVRYRAFASHAAAATVARAAGRILRRPAPLLEPALRAVRTVAKTGADIVHLHGTHLHLNHTLLRMRMGRDRPPMVVHFHGGLRPSRMPLRWLQRHNLRSADRVLVTELSQAAHLDGVLADQIVEMVETSSNFARRDREPARRHTGMRGRPVYLSACRLHPLKDPATTLKAFEHIVHHQPDAHLYHFYTSAELLDELRAYVASRPDLSERVHFRGTVPRGQMEIVYNSADVLLQSSRREFSGCALLEAMACGVIPVVSDVPSFRKIAGPEGLLFPVGDAHGMAERALSVATDSISDRSTRVRSYFEKALSFGAMARSLENLYGELLQPHAAGS